MAWPSFLKGISGSVDLMRIGGASALVMYPAPYLYLAFKHLVMPEPSAFGTGYAAVILAAAAAVGGKELAIAKASNLKSGGLDNV
jgi:4-hydroxybenzoate polyprenyltransferase